MAIIIENTDLIKKVRAKATGATIHWALNKLDMYRNLIFIINSDLHRNDSYREKTLRKISALEETLRLFIADDPLCGCPALKTHKLP